MTEYAYIGRKACGCVVAAVADEPKHRKETAVVVFGYLMDGYTIDRVTLEEARKLLKRCKHKPKPNQEDT